MNKSPMDVSFEHLIDSLPLCMILKDLDGRVVYANQTYLDQYHKSLDQLVGKTDFDLFPAAMAEKYHSDDRQVLVTGIAMHHHEEHVHADGALAWVEIFKTPWFDNEKRLQGIKVLFMDATEKKRTRSELDYERSLLHSLLDNIPDSIYFKDRLSRFTRISRSMADKFCFGEPWTVVGKTDADIFTSEHAIKAREDEIQIMATQSPIVSMIEKETWPNRPDTWCSTTKMPLLNENGEVVGTFGVSRDITEIKHMQDALQTATDVAERANRAKSEFLANMSHEIRTPMNGIIGMAELLADTSLDSQQRDYVGMVQQSAKSLLRILNDILDFSKIEAGKLDLELVATDFRNCIESAMKGLGLRAAQRNLELAVRIDPQIPNTVLCDGGRLQQILVNLVGNAIKFTERGEIAVNVQFASGPPTEPELTVHFFIRDTGIGISPSQQKSIFEAFSQADASTTRKYGGTGLGLSISSQLVSMMNGKIWVESEVGKGTTFHFTARFGIADALTSCTSKRDNNNSEDYSGRCVLVVDDNQTNRVILRETLRKVGFMVTSARDAIQAMERFRSHYGESRVFDVLVVDHMMPEMDGVELLRNLKELSGNSLPPILLYTSSTLMPNNRLSKELSDLLPESRVEILTKPALQSELLFTIHRLLGGSRSESAFTATPKRNHTTSRSLHILLAEDSPLNQAVAIGLLERAGHKIVVVENGVQAIKAWSEQSFDAILMDLQMPIMDGIEATGKIRLLEQGRLNQPNASMGASKQIPIVALTAAAMQGDRERCINAGMNYYLDKPIVVEQLEAVLECIADQMNSLSPSSTTAMPKSGIPTESVPEPSINLEMPLDPTAPLRRLKCNPQQLRVLLKTLYDEIQQRIDELSFGFENADIEIVTRAAHSLKSAAQLFNANEISSTATLIEESSRQGDLRFAVTHFERLCLAASEARDAINKWLVSQT